MTIQYNSTPTISPINEATGSVAFRSVSAQKVQPGIPLFGPRVPTVAPTAVVGAGCTLNSAKFVSYLGEQWFEISATATSSSNNHFEIQLNSVTAFTADCMTYEFQTEDLANLSNPTAYFGTSGYAIFTTSTRQIGAPSSSDPFRHFGTMAYTHHNATFAKSGFTGKLTEQAWVNAKVRMVVANGTSATVRFRSITAAGARRKGRLAITVDDGYDSLYRVGWPLFNRYGFPFSMSIIADRIGESTFMTLNNLKEIVNSGSECVAHGPIGVSGNLFTGGPAYLNDSQRVADMQFHRDYLVRNNLCSDAGAKCYVWPQGRYSNSSGSPSLLTAAQAAGFTVGRTAIEYSEYSLIEPILYRNQALLTLPIIGHSYAGAANTPDDVTETANIATIVGRIQAAAEARADAVLMFHRFVGKGTANTALMIELDRLTTICDAIQTLVNAGTLEIVLMSEFVR